MYNERIKKITPPVQGTCQTQCEVFPTIKFTLKWYRKFPVNSSPEHKFVHPFYIYLFVHGWGGKRLSCLKFVYLEVNMW